MRRLSTSTNINAQVRFDVGFTDSDTQGAQEERGIELWGRLRS
ncbi:hypothetical protein RSO41_13905 [Halomonas sp. I1]|nr:hypothetical protein [Halomonas sp. I1]MDT8895747.1 hypothetical protein [Halomonas sp. I1]